jgi:hypothetical protein
MQKDSSQRAHPLPNPPPQAGEGADRVGGEEQRASGQKEQPSKSADGQSAYFVWLNRGQESLVLDLARADDKALLAAILAKADVFVQNLKPGAIAKLGFPLHDLRRAHPRLVICSISGYGEDGRPSREALRRHSAGIQTVGYPMDKDYLTLKRASASRPSGEWNDDDFDVLANGEVVGRIFKANAAPVGSPWMWTLAFGHHEDRTPTHGYAATREAAMAEFAKSWRRE